MKFITSTEKKSHHKTHFPIIKSLKCYMCPSRFSSKNGLQWHLQITHSSIRQSSCVFCEKICTMSYCMYAHIKRHIQERAYECEIFKKQFYNSSTKTSHMGIHTGEKPWKCKTCSKGFTIKTNLLRHERKHLTKKPYECIFCGDGFTTRRLLWDHILRKIGERAHSCKICQSDFTTIPLLRQHMFTHVPKQHKCRQCKSVFRRPGDLNLHVKKKHTKQ